MQTLSERQALLSAQMPGSRARIATPLGLPPQGTATRQRSLSWRRRLTEAERLEHALLLG